MSIEDIRNLVYNIEFIKSTRISELRDNALYITKALLSEHDRLTAENKSMRNELCYKCGRYENAHLGSCDGCRWRIGNE